MDVDLTLLTGFGDEQRFVKVLMDAFEARIEQAAEFASVNRVLLLRAAEDLLVLKAFADRPKDWLDIEGLLIRQADHLDWRYVRAQLEPLAELKDAPEIVAKLDRMRGR